MNDAGSGGVDERLEFADGECGPGHGQVVVGADGVDEQLDYSDAGDGVDGCCGDCPQCADGLIFQHLPLRRLQPAAGDDDDDGPAAAAAGGQR